MKTVAGADDDSGDCVPAATLTACTAPTANTPGRRRRAILSKRMTRSTESTGSNGNSAALNIESSQCAETSTDESGVVTCTKFKKSNNNANAAALGFLTGALVCALH